MNFYNHISPQHLLADRLESLSRSHPEWSRRYDDAEFNASNKDELMNLLASAPNDLAAGIVYGKMAVIESFAAKVSVAISAVKMRFSTPKFQPSCSSHRPPANSAWGGLS